MDSNFAFRQLDSFIRVFILLVANQMFSFFYRINRENKFFFSDEIYIAPSGVQKERILPEDLFIQNIEGDDIQVPPEYKK